MIRLALLTLLAGCAIPTYETPEAPIDDFWPTEAVVGAHSVAPSDTAWQVFFNSPTLQLLIQTALENNRDLRIASLKVEEAAARYRIQRADLWPAIGISGIALRQKLPGHATGKSHGNTISDYSANLGITAYELDLFGRLRSLSELELELYWATEEAQMSMQIALIAEVANAYLTYLADKKLLDLTVHTLYAQSEALQVIQKSFDIGSASILDLSQATSSVETARVNQFEYARRVAQDKNALALLLGTALDSLACETLDDLQFPHLAAGLPSEVLLNRPDIKQAEHELRAADANLGAARAAFFPSIALTGSVGFGSDTLLGFWPSGSGFTWNFVGQLTQPIFQAGKIQANYERVQYIQQIAIARYEKAIQTAFREVADELIARSTYSDQWDAQKKLVASYQQSHDLAEARYQHGINSYLNVLDAQRALYQAQQVEIIIQQKVLSNWVTLYKVLGGGQL